jgi:hypothetical protein
LRWLPASQRPRQALALPATPAALALPAAPTAPAAPAALALPAAPALALPASPAALALPATPATSSAPLVQTSVRLLAGMAAGAAGSNHNEALHKGLVATFGTRSTGVQMSSWLSKWHRHCFNQRVSERLRPGFPVIGMYATWMALIDQRIFDKRLDGVCWTACYSSLRLMRRTHFVFICYHRRRHLPGIAGEHDPR